jgi:cellulose biosynthesis protein BcsQ
MERIAFMSEKGGTCKTTLAVNTAAYFAQKKGARVLLIDLDIQGHAGKSLGIDVRTVKTSAFHWLTDSQVTLDHVLQPTVVPNLFVLPAYKEMADFPIQVADDPRRLIASPSCSRRCTPALTWWCRRGTERRCWPMRFSPSCATTSPTAPRSRWR